MSDQDTPRNNEGNQPEDELRRMLEQLLGGGMINPDQLAGVAGLPADPQALSQMLGQLQRAMMNPTEGVNWQVVRDAARQSITDNREVEKDTAKEYEQSFSLAQLWLSEVTSVGSTGLLDAPRSITRYEWLNLTLDTWSEIAGPVAESISRALVEMLNEQAPEEYRAMIDQSKPMVKSMGQAMFGMQLGQVLGQLAKEVLSGGDIGMPVLPNGQAALLPQNLAAWSDGLEIKPSELLLYFAVRELAHAHLFIHARWLRLHLVNSITEFARGIRIDTERIEDTVRGLDVSNPEELKQVLQSGQLIPPRSPEQEVALERLETMLALIDGWVDVVTQDATSRLPNADAIAEMVRRRRATGSPAERAFGSLVGLEIRPRRLREATSMWRLVTEKLGPEARDALWDHRDALPGAEDINDPFALVERLRGDTSDSPTDDLDDELARLLGDPDSFGDAPEGGYSPDR
ncbi:zinc-dependent metalloprotease [Gulosibacter chungangensis]|uniref:Zinc-dependent metalloprotease n=1 Tax=Gulosibacter chungangensis TaxID=979746 RepID=A0A7J5BBI3_9MICO|nr:zinc-dependent metalloprotease [Gulosibacter chungangensis]KAB1643466.1 zinc-dependent metalloprotease [Gulosibacter chungangensis]